MCKSLICVIDWGPGLQSVIIADDHEVVRNGMRFIIEAMASTNIVAEAADGLTAISLVKQHSPDLLVLDAAMPKARGIEVFTDCRRWSPNTKVALVTGFTSPGVLSDWLDAGVDGIALKTSQTSELSACFETLLAGGKYVAGDVQELLEASIAQTSLTHREREILTLIAAGLKNQQIAERLSISKKTAEKHRASLMRKLGVKSMAELIVAALKRGLLDEHRQL